MKNKEFFKGKNILIVGLAKSGFAAAKLLHSFGALVAVNDRQPREGNREAERLEEIGISVVCGGHPLSLLDGDIDFVVKNPGIPYENPLIAEAIKRKIPVYTEVEIAGLISEASIIAITGSNGKTTTTTLIGEMLKNSEKKPVVAGNIGTVFSEVAAKSTVEEILVAELSSFQLMGTEQFKPQISVFLNLFEAHLDYHGSLDEYGKAKAKITENQNESDFVVYNADDERVSELMKDSNAQHIPFSVKKQFKNGAYMQDDALYFQDKKIIERKDIVLPGEHNLSNIMAAVAASMLAGATIEQIVNVLTTFAGVDHRLQYVGQVEGRRFYNDSKATNILATKAALSAFEKDVILLAGGLDRGNPFDDLIPALQNVKVLVTFGQTAEKMADAGRKAGIETIKRADNVEEAVPVAYSHSKVGDVILLSPACASWDQYKTFEQRGDMFINSVHKLK
ncbi:UDP-N-acetylmuramoyl-L-alanine--D-glutamate ligase [Fictibacillus phosphorivorans]|uniref:UDP-N-acetylmuramoyl-L-alanine--D-glutamate ligase n=1 Tax=Fictibacillus phosphorivorans TaxID=1221500 RepID=UPI00203F1631|nr:UDP-N-acetylmuramoyl-L-alanine--D-glutamate ligase [Fictibacillus phosphorivorans]MCM3717254.1 UDP-N-acetylmuramoyl-L-alanine--D-glutamate ligase [Fictibacillus phosphorivorans]MCM3774941.1 UDP-N-acetylmuramoyl-L-alanine--D-glutamate ligase [Fictibacillus phosphorivorans]